ncbi:MAG: transposase [Gammaproteobacteria bacterium]|nr:transposase [Gammaproteobacteria bacterium]
MQTTETMKPKRTRRHFTAEFKRHAVELHIHSGLMTIAQVCAEFKGGAEMFVESTGYSESTDHLLKNIIHLCTWARHRLTPTVVASSGLIE